MQTEEWRQILSDWKRRISQFQDAQFEQAVRLDRRHYQLGIPATAFAAIAGTTVFANLGKDFSTTARLIVATISIITAVITAMQTFLNYGKRAESHRSVSNQFGTLRREIDILEQFPPS
jgi:Kef-type K+ transport system membrane component KefB